MLELFPPPMPHATGLDQPFNSLSLQSTRSKHEDFYALPPIRRTSRPTFHSQHYPSVAHPLSDQWPVELSDMTSSHQVFDTSQPASRVDNNTRQAQHGTLALPPSYSSTFPLPPYQSNNQISNGAGVRSSTPSDPRSLAPPPYSGHRRKPSNNAVAPSLQIPHSIRVPQTSVPQLAAEVSSFSRCPPSPH